MRIPTEKAELERLKKELEVRKLIADVESAELNLMRSKSQASRSLVCQLFQPVNSASMLTAMTELSVMSRENPGAPLTLIINSPGGACSDGLALYDFLLHLRSIGHKLTTIALGRAASMGGVLLQAGDVRVMAPNAFLLIHEVSAGTGGTVSAMGEDLAYYKRLQEKLVKILHGRSHFTAASLKRKWKKFDWWLDADEAVAAGFADTVLKPEHQIAGAAVAPLRVCTFPGRMEPLPSTAAETPKADATVAGTTGATTDA